MIQYLQLVKLIIIILILIIVTYTDIKHKVIQDKVLLISIIPGIVLNLFINNLTLRDMILGFLIGGGSIFLIAIISNGGFGGGDIKLMALMGLYIGLKSTVKALIISSILSGFISLILVLFRFKSYKDSIALAPYLSLGIIISFFI